MRATPLGHPYNATTSALSCIIKNFTFCYLSCRAAQRERYKIQGGKRIIHPSTQYFSAADFVSLLSAGVFAFRRANNCSEEEEGQVGSEGKHL